MAAADADPGPTGGARRDRPPLLRLPPPRMPGSRAAGAGDVGCRASRAGVGGGADAGGVVFAWGARDGTDGASRATSTVNKQRDRSNGMLIPRVAVARQVGMKEEGNSARKKPDFLNPSERKIPFPGVRLDVGSPISPSREETNMFKVNPEVGPA